MVNRVEKPKPYQVLPKPNVKRKSGAQPGNLNAYKHGFYSRRFRVLEIKDLAAVLDDSLYDEIAMLRVTLRRLFELAHKEAQTLDEWSSASAILGSTATRLSGLVRTQHLLAGGRGNDIVEMLSESIGIVANELGINKQK